MRILIVEDETKLASLLSDYLTQAGYAIEIVNDGALVMGVFERFQPDLVLLDLMLPNRDGLGLCTDIRRTSQVPIIITTAKVEEIDRLVGLELGADDYICKPYSVREVVARVKAVLRRVDPVQNKFDGEFQLIAETQQVRFQQKTMELTTVEYQLLARLSATPGVIYSRSQLMDTMYSDHRIVNDRTIDSHIKKLRKKLAECFPECGFIHSVYGAGYRFEVAEKA